MVITEPVSSRQTALWSPSFINSPGCDIGLEATVRYFQEAYKNTSERKLVTDKTGNGKSRTLNNLPSGLKRPGAVKNLGEK